MENEKRFQRNPDFIHRKIVDEVILVPIHSDVVDMDAIYSLNSVGAFLWNQLEHLVTQSELKEAVLGEYEAEPELILADLEKFLDEMMAMGAVREV